MSINDYYAARLNADQQAYATCEAEAERWGIPASDLWLAWRDEAQDRVKASLGLPPQTGLTLAQQQDANALVHQMAQTLATNRAREAQTQ